MREARGPQRLGAHEDQLGVGVGAVVTEQLGADLRVRRLAAGVLAEAHDLGRVTQAQGLTGGESVAELQLAEASDLRGDVGTQRDELAGAGLDEADAALAVAFGQPAAEHREVLDRRGDHRVVAPAIEAGEQRLAQAGPPTRGGRQQVTGASRQREGAEGVDRRGAHARSFRRS